MGWLDGLFGSSGSGSGEDPLAKLDPKVREFLQKESPIKYQTAEAAKAEAEAEAAAAAATKKAEAAAAAAETAAQRSQLNEAGVPRESLYQDGRYAHLWKTYRPLAEVEAETKSDHERLMDVLEAYKDRRQQIGRAALESCALEQIEWNECVQNGSIKERMTLCNTQMRKFERCYNMQSRLLKALGYLSTYDRPAEVNDQIQLHADTLYHRMLDQEAAAEKARAEGLPVPETAPIATPIPASIQAQEIPDEVRRSWDEKLAKLPESERAIEEAALRAEFQARAELGQRITAMRVASAAAREQRQAEGTATVRDRITTFFWGNK